MKSLTDMNRVVRSDQSANGVKVTVWRFHDEHGVSGTTVEAECQCFGHDLRAHSSPICPALTRSRSQREQ